MGNLVLEIQTSIDGFIASTDGSTNWMHWNWGSEWTWDSELQQYHNALTLSANCIFISRQMAEEGFIAHWQNAAKDPSSPLYTFARHVTNTPKVVFSNTLNKSVPIPGGWDNTDIVGNDYVNSIRGLKQQYNNLLVYGGATFVSSLIKAGLIDELHFLVNPVAIGSGLSIFNNHLDSNQSMTLQKTRQFSCGIVLLNYKLNSN